MPMGTGSVHHPTSEDGPGKAGTRLRAETEVQLISEPVGTHYPMKKKEGEQRRTPLEVHPELLAEPTVSLCR